VLAKKYLSEVVSVSSSLKNIYTVEFRSLGRTYKFVPGQFLHLALDDRYDGIGQWPESRCFSMQSNPGEEQIRITYSAKGRFTKEMEKVLQVGTKLWLKLPYGELFSKVLPRNKVVFIAGGTGITPFLSLFSDSSFEDYKDVSIYLGFRSKEHNIYEKELKSCNIVSKEVNYFYENENGLIDIDSIYNDHGIECQYIISGPPQMITFFKDRLLINGVHKNNIITDDWE